MKFEVDWEGWNLGEKIIFPSACVAVLSLLMPWLSIEMGSLTVSHNSFQLLSSTVFSAFLGIVLLLAFAYPLKYMLSKEVLNKNLALGFAGAASVVCLYLVYKLSGTIGFGLILFFLCTLSLGFGIWKHEQVNETNKSIKNKAINMQQLSGIIHFMLFWGVYAGLAYLVVNLVK